MKTLAAIALLMAFPAYAETTHFDFYRAMAEADGKCLIQGLPTLVETMECMRREESEVWVGFPASAEQKAAFDALSRDMLADARRADAAGEGFWVLAAKWAAPWQTFYESLNLPRPAITNPDWVRKPTGAEMRTHYPEALKRAKLNGSAMLTCFVRLDGTVAACKSTQETPAGYGVGAAAAEVSASFRMRPMSVNGVPIDGGGPVNIPVNFDKSFLERFFR
jgi:TonB family protein